MKKIKIVTFLLILFFAFLGLYQLNPPAAASISAPLIEFSSGRAIKHLEVIAQKPHPIGSPEHTVVRDYILKELTAQGLSPEVQKTTVVNPRWGTPFVAGTVHNIVARLQGTNNTKAILVAAHYDSVPNSPGASDDGAAVVAMLETIRALRAGSHLRNDIIFLITDGEEPGLLGAKAFVDEHPWAKNIGLVLNFEARGNSGASVMFETSSENGWLIKEFAQAATHPVANSLTYSIYKLLPNDTDLTMFKQAGFPGFNFAYLNGVIHYHTFSDNLENIDERSLQHHGDYILALTRHFGNLDLKDIKKSDSVYFDILGLALIHYPSVWVAPLTVFVVLLFIGAVVLGFRRKQLTFSGIVLSFLAFLLNIVSASLIVTLTWWMIGSLHTEYRAFPQGDTYNSQFYMISFVALTIAITLGLYVWFRKKIRIQNLTVGALLWWLILMVLSSIYLPGASYLFTWPLLFSLVGLGFIFASNRDFAKVKGLVVLTACTIPGIILLAPTIYVVFVALTLEFSGVVMVLVVLLLGLLIPHLCLMAIPNKWLLPTVSMLVSLSFILLGSFTAGFDAHHPKPNSIFYGLNADTGKAIWASADKQTDEWTSQFLSQDTEQTKLAEYFPTVSRKFLKSQAHVVQLTTPMIEPLSDDMRDGTRTVRVRITSPRQARIMRIYVDSNTEVLAATLNGKKIDNNIGDHTASAKNWGFNYFALPKEGIELTLALKPSQPLKLKAVDQSDGLPEIRGKSFPARPNYMIPTGFDSGISDSILVSKSFTL
ncbi:MAG: M20/M25/M40 family metallo-hydrolase [Nostoc sp. NMS7]|uniref:M20/M25/M40 family metallo-hydrolase n=1 Tax=Nostoc sp. NMS7 TaxID=2815391 RepID=UPI0025D107C7|nr:M20/M25/M40 family metallo-hydrolase [Nostoc sp. NMS7]MBN3950372.1 M20/M25/M40 family metallo-hydrolase [Nostoc sp. NMS7]